MNVRTPAPTSHIVWTTAALYVRIHMAAESDARSNPCELATRNRPTLIATAKNDTTMFLPASIIEFMLISCLMSYVFAFGSSSLQMLKGPCAVKRNLRCSEIKLLMNSLEGCEFSCDELPLTRHIRFGCVASMSGK